MSAKLTDAQRQVLELREQGLSPTQIGREMGITSQAVQGHLRRLRAKGAVEPLRRRGRGASLAFDPGAAIEAVQHAIAAQRAAASARLGELDEQIKALQAEKKVVQRTITELDALAATRGSGRTE